ncbi:MAG: nicotinate phosphoribosyltransferase [Armatimonadota bacterium]|nr:MAG: nicotinate phosphoribosyltransferase [Armatimonadota bacterium]
MRFHLASEEEIKAGKVTDVYFARTVEVLRHEGIRKHVLAEVRATGLPRGYEWAVFAGVEEAAALVSGLNATVNCLAEGEFFQPGQPVLTVEGEYTEFCVYETPLLGLLCQASGVATKAARCKLAARDKTVISFGARRTHPALAPMVERNAFLGGCDGVAVVKSGELIGEEPVGTMPHALVLVVGDAAQAFKLFDKVTPPHVARVALVDTLCDEKFEALAAAEALGDRLSAVRLDTPDSRRGDMAAILREVRWELDLRGHDKVGIFVSGGLDEWQIMELAPLADGFGVGTSISNAPVINFALDIVEVEGQPFAKRGKPSGRKALLACTACGERRVVPAAKVADMRCGCGGEARNMLAPLSEPGKIVRDLPPVQALRQQVLERLHSGRWPLEPRA